MTNTIVILVSVCCIIAHIECNKTFIECLDSNDKGELAFVKSRTSSPVDQVIREHIPASMYKSEISCIMILHDNHTTPAVIKGGLRFKYVVIEFDFDLLLESSYVIYIYTLEEEDSSV
ncbi:uncharacterized protein LOC114325735 [Diabrotica virgifera virgifera]|uniref:Uncharacterized protein n=1 Tax=Diabrotica virgifera virgifera TaxID=50390 RepID=A0ABM5IC87_DIAVI|nr:uncharacterized protein LOC114325735 [Diabrotica virgifera virgifera]